MAHIFGTLIELIETLWNVNRYVDTFEPEPLPN